MKKLSTLAAAGVLALATAGGVAAETKKIDTDPFASTQGAGMAIGIVAGLGAVVLIVSAEDTD